MLEEGVGEAIPKMRPMKEDLPQGRRGAEGAVAEGASFQIQVSSRARFVLVPVLSPQGGTRTRIGEGLSSPERVHGFEYEYEYASEP